MPFSNRVLNEYCVCFSTPLSVEIVPLPSFNPPCHTAEPLRCMFLSSYRFILRDSWEFDSRFRRKGIFLCARRRSPVAFCAAGASRIQSRQMAHALAHAV